MLGNEKGISFDERLTKREEFRGGKYNDYKNL